MIDASRNADARPTRPRPGSRPSSGMATSSPPPRGPVAFYLRDDLADSLELLGPPVERAGQLRVRVSRPRSWPGSRTLRPRPGRRGRYPDHPVRRTPPRAGRLAEGTRRLPARAGRHPARAGRDPAGARLPADRARLPDQSERDARQVERDSIQVERTHPARTDAVQRERDAFQRERDVRIAERTLAVAEIGEARLRADRLELEVERLHGLLEPGAGRGRGRPTGLGGRSGTMGTRTRRVREAGGRGRVDPPALSPDRPLRGRLGDPPAGHPTLQVRPLLIGPPRVRGYRGRFSCRQNRQCWMSRPDFSRARNGFEKRFSGPTEVGPTRTSCRSYSYLMASRMASRFVALPASY